jgi:hypothetical protein
MPLITIHMRGAFRATSKRAMADATHVALVASLCIRSDPA